MTKSALARRSSRVAWAAMRLRTSASEAGPRATARATAISTGQSTTITPAVLSRPVSTSRGTSSTTT